LRLKTWGYSIFSFWRALAQLNCEQLVRVRLKYWCTLADDLSLSEIRLSMFAPQVFPFQKAVDEL
jgi:hypothetical protein